MYQRGIDEIFKGLPNISAIADDIFVVCYDDDVVVVDDDDDDDGKDDKRTLR